MPKRGVAVWLSLLVFGATFDTLTTYLILQRGYGEFNPFAAWLIDALGIIPGLAVVTAGSIVTGLILLMLRRPVPYAMGVAYATMRWIPGAHNALLLHGIALDPYHTLAAQYAAMFYIYLYLMTRYYRR